MNSLKLATPSFTMSSMSSRPGVAQVGDDHVQAVIDGGLALGLFPPRIERVAHFGAAGLNGEIDDGGGAAERRRARAGFEIVGLKSCRRTACRGGYGRRFRPASRAFRRRRSRCRQFRRNRKARFRECVRVPPEYRRSRSLSALTSLPLRIRRLLTPRGLPRAVLLRTRCSQLSNVSRSPTRSIVMQSSTGQTSAQRLQPTHSVSSTRGMRCAGVRRLSGAPTPSSFGIGVRVG